MQKSTAAMQRLNLWSEILNTPDSPRVILAAMILSTALGFGALVLGARMLVVIGAVLLPWAPLIARKLHTDWSVYSWLALFELLVILQIAHLVEHLSQMIELHALAWPGPIARGIVGELDIEPVHFWWNTAILVAGTLLLLRYRGNRWLWASWLFSLWHQLEHIYIYFFWFLPKGVSGHPGILGAGGILDQANITFPFLTMLSRPDLHFWYNLFEIGLFTIAFLVQARRVIQSSTQVAPAPRFAWRHALLLVGAAQVAAVTVFALAYFSPPTFRVPQNYPNIQAAVDAAPAWAIIRVAPGTYRETLRITKPLTLIGVGNGLTVIRNADDTTATIAIQNTQNVTLKNLTVMGGLYGILVEESQAVTIKENHVLLSWFAGIRLSRAAAQIVGNNVRGTRSPYGMGIELANTYSRPESLIRANIVADHAREGIVMHNAHAMVENNLVMGNGLRGIAVTEMSMATVRANQVHNNADAGIYVVDHSMAQVEHNDVRDSRPGPLGTAHGIKGIFYAEIMLGANTIVAAPGDEIELQSGAWIAP